MDYYDKTGVQISEAEAAQLLADDSYTMVARTEIGAAYICTHWVAVDQDDITPGAQNIFETRLFNSTLPEDFWPSSTLAEARQRHLEAIGYVRDAVQADRELLDQTVGDALASYLSRNPT